MYLARNGRGEFIVKQVNKPFYKVITASVATGLIADLSQHAGLSLGPGPARPSQCPFNRRDLSVPDSSRCFVGTMVGMGLAPYWRGFYE